ATACSTSSWCRSRKSRVSMPDRDPRYANRWHNHDGRYVKAITYERETADMGAAIAAVADALAALTGTHYTAVAVDVIVGGLADAINARIEAYPIVSGQKYIAFTHGVGGADIPAPTQIESGFIYFSIIDLPVSATFDR